MSATTAVLGMLAELAQTTDPDYLDDAGRIIGSPAAGPKPEGNGDRGGYAQLLTAFMIFAALVFIAWNIRREVVKGRLAKEA